MKTQARIQAAAWMVSLALASAAYAPVYAQEVPPDDPHEKMGRMEEEMFNNASKDLQLTPQQQQRLLENRQAQKTAMAGVREKMRSARMGMKQEFEKDNPDTARLEQLNAEMKGYVGEMIDLRFQGMQATRETLSAEQFRKLGERMEAGRQNRKEGFREKFRSFREQRSKEKGQGGVR